MRRHPLVPLVRAESTNNYRGAPIDELGEESATYAAIRRVQLLFHRRYGTLMNRLRHEKTYHFCKAYGGYPLYSTYDLPHLRKAVSDHGLPGIVSSFTDEEGNSYLVLVNNSPRESGLFWLIFDGGVGQVHRYWDRNGEMCDMDFIASTTMRTMVTTAIRRGSGCGWHRGRWKSCGYRMTDFSRILLATDWTAPSSARAVPCWSGISGQWMTSRRQADASRLRPGASTAIYSALSRGAATLFNAPAILANGACLYDFSAGRILSEQRMEPALVRAVVRSVGQYARAHGEEVGVRVSAAEGIFPDPESRNPYIRKDMQSAACSGAALTVSPDGEQMEELHLYKIVVRGEADAIARVRPLVEAEFGTALTYTSSHPRFFEMNAAGCDKGARSAPAGRLVPRDVWL